jgi:hypothetical protein
VSLRIPFLTAKIAAKTTGEYTPSSPLRDIVKMIFVGVFHTECHRPAGMVKGVPPLGVRIAAGVGFQSSALHRYGQR